MILGQERTGMHAVGRPWWPTAWGRTPRPSTS